MKTLSIAAFFALTANVAVAGGLGAPIIEPQPTVVTTAPVATTGDWTGFYAGAQYGTGSADVEGFGVSVDAGDFDGYGLHAGYLSDLGQYVLGAEIDYNNIELDDVSGSGDLWRLKARAGADLGAFLPYVTVGYARLSADDISENAFVYGLGADYKLTDAFSLGVEYTKQTFKDVLDTDGVDLDADLIQVRASYHF